MQLLTMPRKDKEFRLDERIIAALKGAAAKAEMPINSYVERLLFSHLKTVGEISLSADPLPETRGGKRSGSGKKPTTPIGVTEEPTPPEGETIM